MPRGFPHGNPFQRMGQPWKRLDILQKMVNALVIHERVETTFHKAHETQKYMERVIDIAKYGLSNDYCRDMMEFWIPEQTEKDKLFNVLLPRYADIERGYTRLAVLPEWTEPYRPTKKMAVLELKGNPLPPLPIKEKNPYTLQNVLIAAAKDDWERQREEKSTDV